jgi:hypothetical protein
MNSSHALQPASWRADFDGGSLIIEQLPRQFGANLG